MNPERYSTTTPNVAHSSGSHVPEGQREQPVVEHDTSLEDDAAHHFDNIPGTPADGFTGGLSEDEVRLIQERRRSQEPGRLPGDNVYDLNKPTVSRGKRIATWIALAATLGGGVVFGVNKFGGNDKNTAEAKPQPVATAPANPGSQETSPSAGVEVAHGALTSENVPITMDLKNDGTPEKYTGVKQAERALEFDATNDPTGEAALRALPTRATQWVNTGNTLKENGDYIALNYTSKDGNWGGGAAISEDFIDPTFEGALTSDPEQGAIVAASPNTWTTSQIDMRRQTAQRWAQTKNNAHPYAFKYSIDTTKGGGVVLQSGVSAKELVHATIFVTYGDNFSESQLAQAGTGAHSISAHQAWHVDLQQQNGKWKVIGMQTENY